MYNNNKQILKLCAQWPLKKIYICMRVGRIKNDESNNNNKEVCTVREVCECGGWYIYIVSVVMVVVFEKYKNDRINYV